MNVKADLTPELINSLPAIVIPLSLDFSFRMLHVVHLQLHLLSERTAADHTLAAIGAERQAAGQAG